MNINYSGLLNSLESLKVLSKKQTNELFNKFKQGDMEARDKLIIYNIRIVFWRISYRFSNVKYDRDDLLSIGILGLIKAIDTYDIDKDKAFITYASRCIDNEILMLLRRVDKYPVIYSMDSTFEDSDDKFGDIIADDINIEDNYIANEYNEYMYKIIHSYLNELNERDRKIIMLYFGFYDNKTYTQSEISGIIGINRSEISTIIKKNVLRLKCYINMYDDKNISFDMIKKLVKK